MFSRHTVPADPPDYDLSSFFSACREDFRVPLISPVNVNAKIFSRPRIPSSPPGSSEGANKCPPRLHTLSRRQMGIMNYAHDNNNNSRSSKSHRASSENSRCVPLAFITVIVSPHSFVYISLSAVRETPVVTSDRTTGRIIARVQRIKPTIRLSFVARK